MLVFTDQFSESESILCSLCLYYSFLQLSAQDNNTLEQFLWRIDNFNNSYNLNNLYQRQVASFRNEITIVTFEFERVLQELKKFKGARSNMVQ